MPSRSSDFDSFDMVGQYTRQLGWRQPSKSAIATEAEVGQKLPRDRESLRKRAHVVNGAEVAVVFGAIADIGRSVQNAVLTHFRPAPSGIFAASH
jgi:hypothetical protein